MDWEAFYNQFRTPDFISGYEIQNRLGGGAFGDVYKARKQSIGKAYAIKFLKIEDDSQREAVERELGQVRHFAAIDHPNLVTIEDMGTVMEVPYLIMGYAGEDTLARRLKNGALTGALTKENALLYFVQVCRGVLALHDRRLVHFDLKPSNIFIKGDVARVGDYGLSKLMTDGRMTLSFGRGTPQYMAPEMLRTRADHRADVYSLGVILYEALTGVLPFESESPGGLVLRETDEPPSFAEDFPARLRPAVETCLRLAPEDRFQSVGDLLIEIDQTARVGDSVAIDWQSETVPAAREKQASDLVVADERPTPSSSAELRETAAELAKASVEVARGVWDGLRGAGDKVKEQSQRKSGELKVEIGQAAQEVKQAMDQAGKGLSEATQRTRVRMRIPGWPRKRSEAGKRAVAARAVAKLEAARNSGGGMPANGTAGVPSAGTIPVPPRVEGGLVGTVFSTIVLGLEVLVSLVGNLLSGAVRLFRRMGESALRARGGFFARAFRLAGLVVTMALLGFAVVTVGMLAADILGFR